MAQSAGNEAATNPVSSGHIELIGRIDGYEDGVNVAISVPKEDGVICISEDRTIKVWMKRYNGQYWPSICFNLPVGAYCLDFRVDTHKLVVGLDNGTIMEFQVAEDYNKLTPMQNYSGHLGRVTGLQLVAERQSMISCGVDKCVVCYSTDSGSKIAGYQHNISLTCLQYDMNSSNMYIGDSSGQIVVLSWKQKDTLEKLTVVKKHTASVQQLVLDNERNFLYSASLDRTIAVCSTKDKELTGFQLSGHLDKVHSIVLCTMSNQLFSVGEDNTMICWNLDKTRLPPPKWKESDVCEICSSPFFWNVRSMWESKTMGVRQHHCRRCGKALCCKCSSKTIAIPNMGFELQSRVCDKCSEETLAEKQVSLATFHDISHASVYVHLDESKKILLTAGKDRIIKVWDASSLLSYQVVSSTNKRLK